MRLIKMIANKHQVCFDAGKFDSWCVYLAREGQFRYAPVDTEYFTFLQQLGAKYGFEKVYEDFLQIYNHTTTEINPETLQLITKISEKYGTDAEEADVWFTVIYGGMIAEENKVNAVLKKRIKRLGVYQTLIEKMPPGLAAKFSLGKKWRELDMIMKSKGL